MVESTHPTPQSGVCVPCWAPGAAWPPLVGLRSAAGSAVAGPGPRRWRPCCAACFVSRLCPGAACLGTGPASMAPAAPNLTAQLPPGPLLSQVMLCIQNEERDKMHADMTGGIFKDAVNQALAAGALPAARAKHAGGRDE